METGLQIIAVEGEHRIDSRLVAESLGIEHKHFMETLRTYQEELEELGSLPFQTAVKKGNRGGEKPTYAMLNENQAIFAGTLSRNTRQVVAFKLKLTKAFSEARKRQAPASALHTITDAMRSRALKNLNHVPEGYFSVSGELFKHLYNLEALINLAIDNEAILEISVGQGWSIYAREVIGIADHVRRTYDHCCPNGHVVQAWAYPIPYVNTFATWLWTVYFPQHFPAYQQYRKRRAALAAPTHKQIRG